MPKSPRTSGLWSSGCPGQGTHDLDRTLVCSLYTPDSTYFRMAAITPQSLFWVAVTELLQDTIIQKPYQITMYPYYGHFN